MALAKADREPLLNPQRSFQQTLRADAQAILGIIGLSTSVSWNVLMLNAGLLVRLFGDGAISGANIAQGVTSGVVMSFLTLVPKGLSHGTQLGILAAGFLAMGGIAAALAAAMWQHDVPTALFFTAVAVNGAATGVTQNRGAAVSTRFDRGPGAFLLGQSFAPLLSVAIFAATDNSASDPFTVAALGLASSLLLMLAALLASGMLTVREAKATLKKMSSRNLGEALASSREDKELVLQRLFQLSVNAGVAAFACLAWVFVLCSSPFVAQGICGGDEACVGSAPGALISASNVGAFTGRLLGWRMRKAYLPFLTVESAALTGIVAFVVWAAVRGLLVSPLLAISPLGLAVALGGVTSFWSNLLIMRNDHNSQALCGHSAIAPCYITSQVLWIAMQFGAITGTFVAWVW